HEVGEPADAAAPAAIVVLGVGLAGEIHLDHRVDGVQAREPRVHRHAVGIGGRPQAAGGIAVEVPVGAAAAAEDVADADPDIDALCALVTAPDSTSAIAPSPSSPECRP